MVEFKKIEKFKSSGKQSKKKQIILCHTSREVSDYLTSLNFRYNSNYDKIPNYVVSREGKIFQLLSDIEYSKYFEIDNINRNGITVCMENLGWLEKKPLSNEYINWVGNIYNGQVYEKKWRDYIFWQPYTEIQVKATAELCSMISKNNKISDFVVSHNTKIEGAEKICGIVSKSNFDSSFTDVNPSFDFNMFEKILHNE